MDGNEVCLLQCLALADDRGSVAERVAEQGGTLTFGDQPLTWEELDAPTGTYVVGFVIEDLDGNTREVYGQVTVE